MKYCLACKTVVPDANSTCPKCGAAVRSLGGGSPAAPVAGQPAPPVLPPSLPAPLIPPRSPVVSAAVPPAAPRAPVPQASAPPPVAAVPERFSSGPLAPASLPAEAADLVLQLAGLQHAVQTSQKRIWWLTGVAGLLAVLLISILIWRHFSEVFSYALIEDLKLTSTGRGVVIDYRPTSAGRVDFQRKTDIRTEQLTEFVEAVSESSPQRKFSWEGHSGDQPRFQARFRQGWSLVDRNLE